MPILLVLSNLTEVEVDGVLNCAGWAPMACLSAQITADVERSWALSGWAPMACLGAQITADVEKSWALWLAEPPWPAWVLRLQMMWRGLGLSIWLSPHGLPGCSDYSWCGEVMGTLAGWAPMACLGAQITADVERSWALWLAEPQWPQRSEYLDFVTMGWRDNKILWQISFLDKSNMVHKCSPILLYLVCFCP